MTDELIIQLGSGVVSISQPTQRGIMVTAREKALQQAIALLKASGAEFSVLMPDGAIIGGLVESELAKVKPTEQPKHRLHPGITDYAWGIAGSISHGESAYVPKGEFPASFVQRALASRASARWGNQSYKTIRDDGGVLIIRI